MTPEQIKEAQNWLDAIARYDRFLSLKLSNRRAQVETEGGSYIHLDEAVKEAAFAMQRRVWAQRRGDVVRRLNQLGVTGYD